MLSLSDNKEGDVIEEINFTLRYLDGYLNIGNPFFLNTWQVDISRKANYFDTEAPFLDMDLSITNGIVYMG